MTSRRHLGLLLAVGFLVVPVSYRQELFSQEAAAATTPLDSAAWDALRQGIDDGDAQYRKTAIAAIGTIGRGPEAVKLVVRGLQDKDTLVRQTAAATLGEMGAHDAIPHLKAALDDSPEVSFTAAKSLWDLGSAIKDAKHKLRPSCARASSHSWESKKRAACFSARRR